MEICNSTFEASSDVANGYAFALYIHLAAAIVLVREISQKYSYTYAFHNDHRHTVDYTRICSSGLYVEYCDNVECVEQYKDSWCTLHERAAIISSETMDVKNVKIKAYIKLTADGQDTIVL